MGLLVNTELVDLSLKASLMDAVTLLRNTRVNRYTVVASVVLLYYDFALTLADELRLYWFVSRHGWASFFFFLNRYIGLLGNIPIFLEFFANLSEPVCRRFQYFHQLYCAIATCIISVLLITRTYALYESSKAILSVLVTLLVAAGSVSVWAIASIQHLPSAPSPLEPLPPGFMCDLTLTTAQQHYLAIAWGSICAFDTSIFLLTIYKKIRMGRTVENGLYSLLFRDGTMYFFILVVVYICNLVTFLSPDLTLQGLSVTLTVSMSTTLMNRLMLNVRELHHRDISLSHPSRTWVSSVQFAVRSNHDIESE